MGMHEASPLEPTTTFTHTLPTSSTTTPVDPSTTIVYAPCFDHAPHISPLDAVAITASPPASPPVSSHCSDSPESDGDGDYVPPDDDDDEYLPTQPTSNQKQNKLKTTSNPKSPRPVPFSPSRSTSESGKSGASPRQAGRSHPYRCNGLSRNFQSEDAASFINNELGLHCHVVGCDYIQKNERIPDLRRHIATHGRWMKPDKWICCGVGTDRAHLHKTGISQGMTDGECVEVGAYVFNGRLMIGGCMKTFSRRDSLKRHVDSSKNECVGHMDSYDSYISGPSV
jgi:hypothetical protein